MSLNVATNGTRSVQVEIGTSRHARTRLGGHRDAPRYIVVVYADGPRGRTELSETRHAVHCGCLPLFPRCFAWNSKTAILTSNHLYFDYLCHVISPLV